MFDGIVLENFVWSKRISALKHDMDVISRCMMHCVRHLSTAKQHQQQKQLVPICGRSMCGTCGASRILLF